RLDDDVMAGGTIGPVGDADAAQDLVGGGLLELALVDLALQVARHAALALLGELRGAVGEGDLLAGRGADLGDAVAHQPRADDEDAFDAHRPRRVPAHARSRHPRRALPVLGTATTAVRCRQDGRLNT